MTRRLRDRIDLNLLALAVLLTSGCRAKNPPGSTVPLKIEIRASVMGPQKVNVVAPFDSQVAAVSVTEGATVRSGDFVVSLSNPAIDRDLAHARSLRAIAERRLNNAGSSTSPAPTSSGSAARLRAAAQILKTRKTRLDRYKKLISTRDVTKQELEDAEAGYAAALRDYLHEQQAGRSAPEGEDVELLRLDLEKARADETLAASRKAQLNVTAPMTGVVTRVEAAQGRNVFYRDTLIEISKTDAVDVRGQVAPELLRYIRNGQQVEVTVFTVPPRRYLETIKTIVPLESPGGPAVVVTLPNSSLLQAGTPALISFKPDEKK